MEISKCSTELKANSNRVFTKNKICDYIKIDNFIYILDIDEKLKDNEIAFNSTQRKRHNLILKNKIKIDTYKDEIPKLEYLAIQYNSIMGIDRNEIKTLFLKNDYLFNNSQTFNFKYQFDIINFSFICNSNFGFIDENTKIIINGDLV